MPFFISKSQAVPEHPEIVGALDAGIPTSGPTLVAFDVT